jgi:ATP/ADP translocase
MHAPHEPGLLNEVVLADGPAGAAASSLGAMTLTGLVYGGALLYVFSKSAKFSLFKPAEEMVREYTW